MKTAIEWLQESLSLTFEQEMQFEGLFQQAKEMEKQQIIEARLKIILDSNYVEAEKYYNETFNK